MKLLTVKYAITLASFLTISLQSLKGDDEGKYLSVSLSPDKIFVFEKIEGAKSEAVTDRYKVEQKKRLLQVVEVKTSEKLYEMTAPLATDIDPKLDKGFEGFRGATVLPSGDLILYYYGTRKVYYSRTSKTFTLLPSYLKRNKIHYTANGWWSVTAELLISPCWDRGSAEDDPDEYVVYELGSGKVYNVEMPDNFKKTHFLLNSLDSTQGIVEVETYVADGDARHDPDIIVTGSLGWYKIKVKP